MSSEIPTTECCVPKTRDQDVKKNEDTSRHDVIEQKRTFSYEIVVKQELFSPPAEKCIRQSHIRRSMSTNDLHARIDVTLSFVPTDKPVPKHIDKNALGYKCDQVGMAEFGEVGNNHTEVPIVMKKPAKRLRPCSFEKRNEVTKPKRQEKIEVFEEENKIRQYKAKPIPSGEKNIFVSSGSSSHHDKIKVDKENRSDNFPRKFKAKPATVLKREPFAPVLDRPRFTKFCPFTLASERRAREREIFNNYLKERKEECSRRRALAEQERHAAEEREVARLRKKIVHQAQPVRNYVPIVKPSRLPLTVPKSPNFSTN